MIPIGTEVEWVSQAMGVFKAKRGVVIAHLEPMARLSRFIPPGTPRSRVRGEEQSTRRRYVVEVRERPGGLPIYYTPVAEVLERAWHKARGDSDGD